MARMLYIGAEVSHKLDPDARGTVIALVDGFTTEGRTVLVHWALNCNSYEYGTELRLVPADAVGVTQSEAVTAMVCRLVSSRA